MCEVFGLFPSQTAIAFQPVLQALRISPWRRVQTQHLVSPFGETVCLPLLSKHDLVKLDTYRSQLDKTQSLIEGICVPCSYHIGSFRGRLESFPHGQSDLVSAPAEIVCPASVEGDGHEFYQNVGIKRRNRVPKWVHWNGDIQTCNPQLNAVSTEVFKKEGVKRLLLIGLSSVLVGFEGFQVGRQEWWTFMV